ncbi:hypothetical protein LBW89_01380 [Paenibacillus sp. alder61]|uniref:Uncharacterized protein n=1 Tax=Paenibacillus faecis TaxID=862114 RepID=A0A5D0CYX5_9BACL|nr:MULTISPECIES: hypothetical protein [Paenibacillus]MCA1291660.1 hypothetical protein [Paenibacillus sp. alder61]TYA14898.1 hypothetical protein FRY98_04325 [Paenibacillus faecis]
MKANRLIGPACGFLGGTTFGSGLAFLLGWMSYPVIASVSFFGLSGAVLGALAVKIVRKQAD